jgi:hypothetical protein
MIIRSQGRSVAAELLGGSLAWADEERAGAAFSFPTPKPAAAAGAVVAAAAGATAAALGASVGFAGAAVGAAPGAPAHPTIANNSTTDNPFVPRIARALLTAL